MKKIDRHGFRCRQCGSPALKPHGPEPICGTCLGEDFEQVFNHEIQWITDRIIVWPISVYWNCES